MKRTPFFVFAALAVTALGVALGAYLLRQPEPSDGAALSRGPAGTASPLAAEAVKFTPYPTLTPTGEEQKEFRARLAKLAIKRLVEYYGMDKDKNVVFSPVCSMSTLGMLLPAASGSTEQVILDELCMSGRTPEWVLNNFREYFAELKKLDKDITPIAKPEPPPEETEELLVSDGNPYDAMCTFRTANSVWTNRRWRGRPEFGHNVSDFLLGDPFSTAFDASAQADADAWIVKKTTGLIKNVGLGKVDRDTALVAISAALFSSRWLVYSDVPFFPVENTKDRVFNATSEEKRNCPFMECFDHWSYIETQAFRAVEIPFSLEDTYMLVVLPSEELGVKGFLELLPKIGLTGTDWQFARRPGTVRLPKFNYRCEYEKQPFVTVPGQLRLDRAYAVAPEIPLTSRSRQVAEIEIDERGAKAMAVEITAIYGGYGASHRKPPPPFELTFDRPFVFFIMGPDSEVPLFAGIVNDPTDKGKK